MITLQELLDLVGKIDDTEGDDTGRERFRKYLRTSVKTIGAVRDYADTCLRISGPQYNRALQDLINHVGKLIGFEIEFGRYHGVSSEIGHDGLWKFNGLNLVIEVKTTDTYTIDPATIVGYIDRLISNEQIPDWDHALGLYVVGRTGAGLDQLSNTIIAQKRSHQLRIITIENLLSLAELVQNGDINLDEAVGLIKPTGVLIDETVRLLARVASGSLLDSKGLQESQLVEIASKEKLIDDPMANDEDQEHMFLITPLSDRDVLSAKQTLEAFLSRKKYVFGERTPGRKLLKIGDFICFYAAGVGVIGHAIVNSNPVKVDRPVIPELSEFLDYPWAFDLTDIHLYLENPTVVDANLRGKLDAFESHDPEGNWGWFVQTTRKITEHDFKILTRL